VKKIINNKEIDNKVKLYFFDLDKKTEDYIQFYQQTQSGLYAKCNTHLYSPLYLVLKDARYCFGGKVGNSLPSKLPPDAATFAGVLLIDIAFRIISDVFFDLDDKDNKYTAEEKIIEFAKKYMSIDDKKAKLLRLLRNSLNHSDYSTNWESKDGDRIVEFTLTDHPVNGEIIIVKNLDNFKVKCLVNPLELILSFEKAIKIYENFLLDNKNTEARDNFYEKVNVKKWMGVQRF